MQTRQPHRAGLADAFGGDPAPPLDLMLPVENPASPRQHGADGHRARLRQRLLTGGEDAIADHEMLELVLFLALPRRDTKPIARALLRRFGSYAAVVSAPPAELSSVEGLGQAGIAALKIVRASALRLARSEASAAPVFSNWDRLIDYLKVGMARERVEEFRILFLDNKNRMLADEAQSRGTVNHAPVYPREVARRALELHATGLILVHNHPSGDPTPSQEDIAMTREIMQAVRVLGIAVHDHVVIGRSGWISMRQAGLIG